MQLDEHPKLRDRQSGSPPTPHLAPDKPHQPGQHVQQRLRAGLASRRRFTCWTQLLHETSNLMRRPQPVNSPGRPATAK